jgi:EAL domain-containing protein (putative c-di-GMP-specific phosphodiesterase class I)
VKIDQVFVRQVVDSDKAREIIASVIQLASKLKMSIIAEGVETTETLDMLQQLGCRFAQGFLFSPALPLPDFIVWCKANHASGK